ncbi:hypothetical protein C0995_006757 [Termitomyces sp. Mi166|nr:hypothetical protein C0995_006757 [Termitomyces sp. Mi166\
MSMDIFKDVDDERIEFLLRLQASITTLEWTPTRSTSGNIQQLMVCCRTNEVIDGRCHGCVRAFNPTENKIGTTRVCD